MQVFWANIALYLAFDTFLNSYIIKQTCKAGFEHKIEKFWIKDLVLGFINKKGMFI